MNFAHLQLLDSALPVGAFSHSFGLETLAQNGRVQTPEQLAAFCRTMLRASWAPCDALVASAAWMFAPDWDALWQLDAQLHASRSAQETREGHTKMGRRLRELGRTLHPTMPWPVFDDAVARGSCFGTHATTYGWLCFHLGVSRDEAALGYLHNCANATLNNAVRLLRIGQTGAQTILTSLAPDISEAWNDVRERSPREFATATPELDLAQMQHETLYSRLFMS